VRRYIVLEFQEFNQFGAVAGLTLLQVFPGEREREFEDIDHLSQVCVGHPEGGGNVWGRLHPQDK
jgi:hypothetical protein